MTTPRLITKAQAAEYLGLSTSAFDNWVAAFRLPRAIPGTRRWDKNAIDAMLDDISGLSANDNDNDDVLEWEKKYGNAS